ncbi:helix-turn-helix domain-containing protein [Virgibacillus ainsalahensis]
MGGLLKRLENLREEKNLTKRQMSIQLGYSKDTYGRWENGKGKFSYEVLVEIAKIHNVSLDYLLTGKEYQMRKMEPHEKGKAIAKS